MHDELTGDEVVTERFDGVATIRINRPSARNALNVAVMAGIGRSMLEADADPDIRAVVLTGTGDRAFCAGMDLRAFSEGQMQPDADQVAGMEAFATFIGGNCATPVVGAANATAVAGGFELLLACDLIVAAEDASFGIPEVKRGLFAAGGGIFLARRIPLAIALELGLTGDLVDAPRAAALGLVNRVVPATRVMDTALDFARQIAGNGPLGVQATRTLMRAAAAQPDDEVLRMQAELRSGVFDSEDAREGATAFVEKRTPIWKGR
jgi:enoyl-CoA hydratase/carnithine racemase